MKEESWGPTRDVRRCSPNSRPGNDFQFDQPPVNRPRQIIFRASRGPDPAHIWKVDRAVGLHARGRVQLRMINEPDGDDIRSRENPAAAFRRRRACRREKQSACYDRQTAHPTVAFLRARAAGGAAERPAFAPLRAAPALPPSEGTTWAADDRPRYIRSAIMRGFKPKT
jgi:hypothetical protein